MKYLPTFKHSLIILICVFIGLFYKYTNAVENGRFQLNNTTAVLLLDTKNGNLYYLGDSSKEWKLSTNPILKQ